MWADLNKTHGRHFFDILNLEKKTVIVNERKADSLGGNILQKRIKWVLTESHNHLIFFLFYSWTVSYMNTVYFDYIYPSHILSYSIQSFSSQVYFIFLSFVGRSPQEFIGSWHEHRWELSTRVNHTTEENNPTSLVVINCHPEDGLGLMGPSYPW